MSREVPDGWTPVKLGAAASNVAEKWEPGEHAEPYVGLEQVDQGTGRLLDIGVSDDLQSIKTRFRAGDVLFGKLRPNLRKTALVDFSGIASTDILVIRPSERMTPEFAFYRLSSDEAFDYAIKSAAGTKMPRTSWKDMADFEFPLPPLHEQRGIAEILSSVDEAIAAMRAVIEQTRKVKQGVLERLLTKGIGHTRFKQTEIGEIPEEWEVVRLNHVAERTTYGFTNPMSTVDDGPWMITAANILEGKINYKSARKTDRIEFETLLSEKSKPAENTVLITKDGTLGRVAIVDKGDICINQSVASVTPNESKILPRFLYWLLQSPSVQSRILAQAGGSTIKHIYISKLAETVLQLPPLTEQEEIVRNIDLVEVSFERERKHFDAMLGFKSALMSDLLSGRKRVTDALPMAAE